jgi:uncharacterized protein YndB with AHSA1/START domain
MSTTDFKVDKQRLEVRMSRVINAPRERVWQAHIDPTQIAQWWGPRRYTTEVEQLDPKVGGKWKFANKQSDGKRHVFYGEFLEVQKPEKITWTFIYEPYPDAVVTETLTLEELPDGKTKLSTLSKYPSIQALEGMVQGGMEEGARETWDRLAELVE